MQRKLILVTGGAGYIGSHMVRRLLDEQFKPIIFDNLSTGHREFVPKNVPFIRGDLRNEKDIKKAFINYQVDAVMHFAGSALVPESMSNPMKYYENNVYSSINLLKSMIDVGAKKIIFSSTCSVYGEPNSIPINEDHDTRPTNPYGYSKLVIEKMLEHFAASYGLSYVSLRYFNVAGAHNSGKIGEWHVPETHLIPNILNAASKKMHN